MKKLLTDWRAGAAALLAVVLICTPIGAKRSLRAAVEDVEAGFWEGAGGRIPLADFVVDAKNAATGLLVMASRYEVDAGLLDSLRKAQTALMDYLDSDHPAPSGLCFLVEALDAPMEAVSDALRACELDEMDTNTADLYREAYVNARSAMGRSNYNESVDEFIVDVYCHFPSKLIGSLLGVDPPEKFQYE